MPTLTQPQRDDAVGGFAQLIRRYQAELAAADRALNPWLTATERAAERPVLVQARTGLGGQGVDAVAPAAIAATPIGAAERANVVRVGG